MTNLVQFPGLGLQFTINRVAFSIGGVNIYWYGVCIAYAPPFAGQTAEQKAADDAAVDGQTAIPDGQHLRMPG